jgi:hypothetical protein
MNSGSSDDILWGTLAMLGASRRFLNLDYLPNGARGPVLLYSEVEDRFELMDVSIDIEMIHSQRERESA